LIDPSSIVHRLDELRAELAAGEQALRELDAERSRLVAALVRLGGAVRALEEVLELHARAEGAQVR
jgi:hypothetical protein